MTLDQAKNKVLEAVNDNSINNSKYKIDTSRIIETEFAWFIPFIAINQEEQDIIVGAYNGFIVGKTKGDLHQPGSAIGIDKWLLGYKLGLLDSPQDLVVTRVKDLLSTKQQLKKLKLQYFKPEIENGTIWKIPRTFKEKMIDDKLASLPCIFRNQRFLNNIDEFDAISKSNAFEYELRATPAALTTDIGEEIE